MLSDDITKPVYPLNPFCHYVKEAEKREEERMLAAKKREEERKLAAKKPKHD